MRGMNPRFGENRMRKTRFLAFLAVFAVLLASCSGTQKPIVISEPPATRQAIPPASSAPALPSPPLQSPTPPLSPAATPTLGPTATPLPADAPLTDSDYFIIDKNWVDVAPDITTADSTDSDDSDDSDGSDNSDYRDNCVIPDNGEYIDGGEGYRYGVVDAHGDILVPFAYTSITEMLFDTDKDSNISKYHYFFAEEYAAIGGKVVMDSGYLYDVTDKQASDARYDWMRKFGDSYIIAKRTSIRRCGIMTPDLHVVVPFNYDDIVDCGEWLAASYQKDGACWIDFLSKDLTLMGTLQAGGTDISYLDDGLLLARGLNGKLGFVDGKMTWCAEPQWDELVVPHEDNDLGPGYPMLKGDTQYNVNRFGKTFIPKGCDPEDCQLVYSSDDENSLPLLYKGNNVYIYSDEDGANLILFTDAGKIIYKSSSDTGFEFDDGVIVDGNKAIDLSGEVLYQSQGGTLYYSNGIFIDNGRAVDKAGKDLLPGVANVTNWDPKTGLFECGDNEKITDVYTQDGKRLPFPVAQGIECVSDDCFVIAINNNDCGIYNKEGKRLTPDTQRIEDVSADRFVVETDDGNCGLCNAKGEWIVTPQPINLIYFWPCYSVEISENVFKQGLMDDNGRIIYGPEFDEIQLLSSSRGLYEVLYDGRHGIIDAKGHWIWYNGEYSALTD
jgi:hypothetical protein